MGNQQINAIVRDLQGGSQDPESLEVRHAALRASVAYLSSISPQTQAQAQTLVFYMLDTLPSLPPSRASAFIQTVTTLASSLSAAHVFAPHLPVLLNYHYLSSLILPQCNDPGPRPTVGRPFPASEISSSNSVQSNDGSSTPTQEAGRSVVKPPQAGDDLDHEYEETRKAALELLVSLTEARPGMVNESNVGVWVDSERLPSDDPTDESHPHVFLKKLLTN